MPQFDISSFLVQLIWLFLTLIIFYSLLCLFFLPTLNFYLRTRELRKTNKKNKIYFLFISRPYNNNKSISINNQNIIF